MNQVKSSNEEKYEGKKKNITNLSLNQILVEEELGIHKPSVASLVEKFNSNKRKIFSKKRMTKVEKYY
jgi:hypothetical protein